MRAAYARDAPVVARTCAPSSDTDAGTPLAPRAPRQQRLPGGRESYCYDVQVMTPSVARAVIQHALEHGWAAGDGRAEFVIENAGVVFADALRAAEQCFRRVGRRL
jgi:hypothetical protein